MKGRPRNAKIPKIITKVAAVVWKHLFLELQVSVSQHCPVSVLSPFPMLQPRLHLPPQLTAPTFAHYCPVLSTVKFFSFPYKDKIQILPLVVLSVDLYKQNDGSMSGLVRDRLACISLSTSLMHLPSSKSISGSQNTKKKKKI